MRPRAATASQRTSAALSARVWDADAVESMLVEADRMSAEVAEDPGGVAIKSPGVAGMSSPRGMDSPLQYEARRMHQMGLIRDLIATENSNGDTRLIIGAISQYLVSERRRVKTALEDFREAAERFATLEGPRHLLYISEGFSACPASTSSRA